ncbi:MAG: C39 family peptidase [Patescibacteria group bacterium]
MNRILVGFLIALIIPNAANKGDSPSVVVEDLPVSVSLDVPFTSQAPTGDWKQPFFDSCEEAALLMVHSFFSGKKLDSVNIAKEELLKIVDWEVETFGYFKDTNSEETAQILREMLGHERVEVVYDFSFDELKWHLSQGRPVILPAAGRLLENPYFRPPGPPYHMFVVTGYTAAGSYITNEPGTKKGRGLVYSQEVLENAVHDWNNGDVINGRRAMIVVWDS